MSEPKGLSFGDDPTPAKPTSNNLVSSNPARPNNSSNSNSSGASSSKSNSAFANLLLPKLLPTNLQEETFGDVTYQLQGELVPVLTIDLSKSQGVYFEHHILLWKHPTVRIAMKSMKGMFKRMIAGMQIFMTEASGKGCIAFSRDGAGHIVPIHLKHGYEVDIREHQFLAATSNIDYDFERVRGIGNMFFGGAGFFIDKFKANQGDGIVWVHGYGNVFEKTLAAGEVIDIETGGWLYKSPSVQMETKVDNLTSGFFGGMKFIVNRFTGPGKVGIQSMYIHNPDGTDDGGSNATQTNNNNGNTVGTILNLIR